MLCLSVLALAMPLAASAQLDATLTKLDTAAANFHSATADFHKDLYTAVIKDHDLQDGITYTNRGKDGSEVGIKITGKGERIVTYKKGVARDFLSGAKCFNTYDAAKSKDTIESLLALAFGASGKELSAKWIVKDEGLDTAIGKTVEKLDLVPKDQGLKNNITHITLWTDLTRAIALKEIVYSPSGDTQTATYSNIQYNGKVDASKFAFGGKACSK